MSTDRIFGGWDTKPDHLCEWDDLMGLWHILAAQEVGKPNFRPNFGLSQRRPEIVMLWSLFKRLNPQVICEIGIAQGGTWAGWCALANEEATLIGIDRDVDDCRPRPGDPCPSYYAGELKFSTQGGGMFSCKRGNQKLMGINGWSFQPETVDTVKKMLAGRQIDFLWSDASHSSEMFHQEFDAYWPLVSDGGIFCSHDINWSADPKCDKQKAWQEITRTATYSARYEFLPHISVSEMGIGVLIK